MFQRAPFAGYLFAGSETLIGFDRRSHLARISCGASTADTERTRRGEDRQFLHLRVRKQDCDLPARDVLISDLSGEDYRDAKDSVEECRRLSLIRRADHFVILIDSHHLAQLDDRQRVKNEATMLLRCCLDSGQLGPQSLVDVLCSKWDLIDENDEVGTVEFVRSLNQTLTRQFEPQLKRLRFSRIAARPAKAGFGLGHGLAEIFPAWVEEAAAALGAPIQLEPPPVIGSEFDRFFSRRPTNLSTEVSQ